MEVQEAKNQKLEVEYREEAYVKGDYAPMVKCDRDDSREIIDEFVTYDGTRLVKVYKKL